MNGLRRPALLSVAVLTMTTSGAAQQRDLTRVPIFFTVPGMDDVRVERDVVFRSVGETQLKADVYLPRERGTYGVVLLVSGGAVHDWRTSEFYTSLARVLAAEGIAAVSYDKRLSREPGAVQAAAEDSRALVRHLTENAATYGVDMTRMCTWHFSAGGTLAGAALGEGSPAACVMLTYAVLSFGDEDKDPRLAPHSALVQARQRGDRFPPTLVVRAGRDSTLLNDRIDAFVAAALEKNAPLSVINYPGGAHGFEIVNDTDETRRVIRESIDWLKHRIAGR